MQIYQKKQFRSAKEIDFPDRLNLTRDNQIYAYGGVTVIGQYFWQVKQQSFQEHAGMISKGGENALA